VLKYRFTFEIMFVRCVKNRNGNTYVQIVDKSGGKYKVIKSIGNSKNPEEVNQLISLGKTYIDNQQGLQRFDFTNERLFFVQAFNAITTHKLVGVDLLLGNIFDQIGFNQIADPIFKQLVLYRLVYPTSKLKTTEYLYRYQQIDWDENKVYRYLDKLYKGQKEIVQQISYAHTVSILQGNPQIVFYDVTTIYFEIEQEDDLRKTGFSKEGKHQNPQIVLGLLVSKNGYPLAYDVFDGKKFEGHTLLPIIENFKTKYQLQQLIVVADAGLLSNTNMTLLNQNNYEFILGARIKNENKALQQQILSSAFKNGETKIFPKDEHTKLIVSYSDKRATKDGINRERGLKRLEQQIQKGRLTKANINNKGYNKYLKLIGDIEVSIDYQKYKADAGWDGLKGYITNSQLSTDEVLENYNQLWQIEKAFRVSKTDLKIRPIYHRLPKRIEAHICLNFVAYKVYKELERQLKEMNANISTNKAIEIAQSIFEIQATTPTSNEKIHKTLIVNQEQAYLANIFSFGC
jgi:transposase